jgi:hypothetical protein
MLPFLSSKPPDIPAGLNEIWHDLVRELRQLIDLFTVAQPEGSAASYEGGEENQPLQVTRRVCCGPLCFQLKLICAFDLADKEIKVESRVDFLPGSLSWLPNDEVRESLDACRTKFIPQSTSAYEIRPGTSGADSWELRRKGSGAPSRRSAISPVAAAADILRAFLSV